MNDTTTKRPGKRFWLVLATLIVIAVAVAVVYNVNRRGAALTEAEGAAITGICAVDFRDFDDISAKALTKERSTKFPAVAKAYKSGDLYAFIVKPIAYNGPVTLALVIDGVEIGRAHV